MGQGEVRGELLAAGRRVFASRGYAGATVDDIVRASGTSRASFYRYFSGKDQLFDELSRACFAEMRQALRDASPVHESQKSSRRAVDLVRSYQGLNDRYGGVIRVWTDLSGPADSPMRDRGTAAVQAMFAETARMLESTHRGSPPAAEENIAAALLFLLIERSFFYVCSQVSRLDPGRLVPTLATLVERGYLAASLSQARSGRA